MKNIGETFNMHEIDDAKVHYYVTHELVRYHFDQHIATLAQLPMLLYIHSVVTRQRALSSSSE